MIMKMNCQKIRNQKVGIWIGFSIFLSGCFGAGNDVVSNTLQAEVGAKPIVEGYFEFPGPSEKWAGPQNYTVHVFADRDVMEQAQISVSPSFFALKKQNPRGLTIASQGPSAEFAREELSRLNTALQSDVTEWQGCLLPIRVRLIRVDGVVIERQGCRGQPGWPRLASEIASRMIEYGMLAKKEKN